MFEVYESARTKKEGRTSTNLYLQYKWDCINYENHRYNILTAKSKIDNGAPRTFPHLYYRPKKLQLEQERFCAIQRENKHLMDRLATIQREGGWIDNKNFHEIKSLNTWKRQQEMIELSYNNQTMLSRLLDCHSQYNHHKLEDEYLLSRKHKANVEKYPKDWKSIMYQMKCLKKHIREDVINFRTGKIKRDKKADDAMKAIKQEALEMERADEEAKQIKLAKERERVQKSEREKTIKEQRRAMAEWKKASNEWRKAREERLLLAQEKKAEEERKLKEVKEREKRRQKKKRDKIKKELEEWRKWKDEKESTKKRKEEEEKRRAAEARKRAREKRRLQKEAEASYEDSFISASSTFESGSEGTDSSKVSAAIDVQAKQSSSKPRQKAIKSPETQIAIDERQELEAGEIDKKKIRSDTTDETDSEPGGIEKSSDIESEDQQETKSAVSDRGNESKTFSDGQKAEETTERKFSFDQKTSMKDEAGISSEKQQPSHTTTDKIQDASHQFVAGSSKTESAKDIDEALKILLDPPKNVDKVAEEKFSTASDDSDVPSSSKTSETTEKPKETTKKEPKNKND